MNRETRQRQLTVDNPPSEAPGRKLTLRTRLLLSVNVTLVALLATFLIHEYHRTLNARMAEKHRSLQDEAGAVAEAVAALRHHGDAAIQKYIDAVCQRMQETSSPGHHVVVELNGSTLQARAHHRASAEIAAAMQSADEAPTHRVPFRDSELVVGSGWRDNVHVYVSEYGGDIRRSVLADIVWHLFAVGLGGIIAALIVNFVLYRTVDKPLRRLVKTVTEIGQGQFGVQSKPFKSAELACLSDAINSMSSGLAEAEKERNAQMKKAKEIQQNLLPEETDIPGLQVTTLYRPADEVSGDYYDVFRLPDKTWLVCIADVVGHGIPAAMTAAMLKTLLLEATRRQTDPAAILELVNEGLSEVALAGDFASMCLARWHPTKRRLQYASAGHGSVCLISKDGGACDLPSTGLLLGVDAEASWYTTEVEMLTADRLVLATDGVTETMNSAGQLFGNQCLIDILSANKTLPLSEQVRSIERAIGKHRDGADQKDDVTLILLQVAATDSTATVDCGARAKAAD